MPIQPSSPPKIRQLSPTPNRATDTQEEFSNKTDTFLNELDPFGQDQNTLADWSESTSQGTYTNAVQTFESSSDAVNAAQVAEASANFIGEWSSLTGSVSTGQSVLHNGAYWVALVDIADVTVSEPGVSSDWSVTGSLSLVRHSKMNNPIYHLFKNNKLTDTINGNLTVSRNTSYHVFDRYGNLHLVSGSELREGKNGWAILGEGTNYILGSEDLLNPTYYPSNVGLQGGGTILAGVLTLEKIVPTTDNSQHYIRQNFSDSNLNSSLDVTASIAIQSPDYRFVRLYIRENDNTYRVTQNYDLENLSLGGIQELNGAEIQGATIEKYGETIRLSLSAKLVNADRSNTQVLLYIIGEDSASPPNFPGDGSSGIYMGGLQLESTPFYTGYIPTTNAIATRGAPTTLSNAENNMPDSNKSWSIAIWANMARANPFNSPMRVRDSANTRIVELSNNGDVAYGVVNQADGELVYTGFNYQIEDKMCRFVITYNGLVLSLYVDGQFKNSATVAGTLESPVGGTIRHDGESYSDILDVKIWDFELNASEIALDAGI